MALTGCGAPDDKAERPKKPRPEAQSRIVLTEAAEATRWSGDVPPQPLWMIRWESAELQFESGDKFGGNMKNVSGQLYEGSKKASEFAASRASADAESGELNLVGSIMIRSLERQTTLSCSEVKYTTKGTRLIRARGGVALKGDWGTVEGIEELVATPSLKRFGTRQEFEAK